jgi:hypothetical protein
VEIPMAELVVQMKGVVASCRRSLKSAAERLDDWIDGLDGLSEAERKELHAERERHAEEATHFRKSFPFLWH